jgi:hypothetical protein
LDDFCEGLGAKCGLLYWGICDLPYLAIVGQGHVQ